MRTQHLAKLTAIVPALAAGSLLAQGTFVYDQQSSTNEGTPPYGGDPVQSIPTPWGQSFTPGLSGIDFIRLELADVNPLDGSGASMYINLRSDSITGAIIATTQPVTMPNGFAGHPDFFFPARVPLTPGVQYYFEAIVDPSSGPFSTTVSSFYYPGGSYIAGGSPALQSDLWFREGIVTEPSSLCLVVMGGAAVVLGARGRTPTRRTAP
jgi:hypothetical protein